MAAQSLIVAVLAARSVVAVALKFGIRFHRRLNHFLECRHVNLQQIFIRAFDAETRDTR